MTTSSSFLSSRKSQGVASSEILPKAKIQKEEMQLLQRLLELKSVEYKSRLNARRVFNQIDLVSAYGRKSEKKRTESLSAPS